MQVVFSCNYAALEIRLSIPSKDNKHQLAPHYPYKPHDLVGTYCSLRGELL